MPFLPGSDHRQRKANIAAHRHAKKDLIREKNNFEAIIAAIGDGISIQDRDFKILYQNQKHKNMMGDHAGEYCYTAYESLNTICEGCPVAETFRDGKVHTAERSAQFKEGMHFFEITSSSLKDESGGIVAGIEAVREITDRKRMEMSLKERNVFIETILDNLPIGLAVNRTTDGKVIYLNPAFEKIYGWPKTYIADVDSFFEHVYPDPVRRTAVKDRVMADIMSGDPRRMRWDNIQITTQQGGARFVTAMNIPLFDQGLMISTVFDVTHSKQTEHALTESENRYKRLVESVTDYIYTVEVDHGRAVATTHGPGCVSVTGYSSEDYRADADLWSRMIYEEDRKFVIEKAAAILTGVSFTPFEHRIIHKDGSLRWVRNTPVPRFDKERKLISYDGLISDITPVKLLENQLRQAQKMEAVGQLAGGVAHDFNNILTAIIGYSNLLMMKMPQTDICRTYVDSILSSAERAANLTHSLLAFSRKQIIDLKPVNVNEIITRVEKLLCRVIGEDIEFKTRLCGENLIVLADSIQIEQILMNLATNARDAMPNGGSLLLETDSLEIGEEFVRAHSYGKPGRYALIAVTDTGIGMDENVKGRIFEPFFTTKEMGKGTGLGLAMVYGIVKQHNGYIHVYSEPGRGTTFKIYLPRIASPADNGTTRRDDAVKGGSETVLLAEDDSSVRKLSKSVLEDFGYTVIEAVDGEDAIRKFNENREAVGLLVLDIIMPKKNGKETYVEIRKIKPGIKALFTSGYTADVVHQKKIMETGMDFIVKPASPTAFLKKVREVLDKK